MCNAEGSSRTGSQNRNNSVSISFGLTFTASLSSELVLGDVADGVKCHPANLTSPLGNLESRKCRIRQHLPEVTRKSLRLHRD